jgi:LuxR family maltose regulon positive regulatory protein
LLLCRAIRIARGEMSSQTAEIAGRGLRVIEPKLIPPRVHAGTLRRERLLRVLGDHPATPLTMLNAGVGYGKTTLVRSWCVERPEAVIWVSLDAADEDPVRLWTHVATAVERLDQGRGHTALIALGTRGAPIETVVDELMNGLVAYGRAVSIVLDDLHAVSGAAALGSIAHAIERLPANVRVLATTRADPAIRTARLRARRDLTEIRAHELAFTLEETHELLARERISLSPENVALLADRTEGWPAGLYLAALWLREHPDPNDGVRAFAGTARHVGDYLTDEVLAALAPDIRDFLVRTSVLGRFTPELCDAVLDRENSTKLLSELARSNMFLVALDSRGEWYRYHHLFGEVLQLDLEPEMARGLRRRAAEWCRAEGLVEDAIEYAVAAEDAELVAGLLSDSYMSFVWGARFDQLLRWVRWLPADLLEAHPILPAIAATAAAVIARPDVEVRRLLAVADRSRRERPEAWSPDIEALVELTSSEVFAADIGAAIDHGRRAVAAARAGSGVLTVGSLVGLAQALFFAGQLDEMREISLAAVQRPDAPEFPNGYLLHLGLLAMVDAEQGRLETAQSRAREALNFARARYLADTWLAAAAHLGLAMTCAATGHLDDAEREAQRGELLRRAPHPTVGHTHALLVLAQIRVKRSRLARATNDLEHARRALSEFTDPGKLSAMLDAAQQQLASVRADPATNGPIEDPSPAELAVLRALATGLSRRQIGAQLYISLNTVKTHTRELYRKLGATSRADAIARADALGLLDDDRSPG